MSTKSGHPNVLAVVLAGGEGSRLAPLTRERAKPAVPFGGRYRLIDFVLSNLVNSGFLRIKVLTQYKSQSLNAHISRGWNLSSMLDNYVELVPAQMRIGKEWFRGSADAVYQNLNMFTDETPDHVAVFGADHIYKMDVSRMLALHAERDADCTVAAIPVPLDQAESFGVIEVDRQWRMVGFEEKPTHPKSIPDRPDLCLASMGNYLFRTPALLREILRDSEQDTGHDFGRDIIASMWDKSPVYVYDFSQNDVPGMTETERGYWRDVGTLESYYESSMDLVAVSPVFNLYNSRWPIHTAARFVPPAKFVFDWPEEGRVGSAVDSLICEGCIISGGRVIRSILSPGVRINSYARVEDSILFDGVSVGRRAKIRRAIIDKGVRVPEGAEIGYDLDRERERFTVTDNGIVVIAKGTELQP